MSWMLGFMLATALAGTPAAAAPAPLDEILLASGVQSRAERVRLADDYRRVVAEIDADLRSHRPTYRRARRAHRMLHERYLVHYEEDADGLQGILDGGRYNCLSATLFVGLAMRELGYDAEVVEIPGHVFLRLYIGERTVDVETTARHGFDVSRVMRGFGRTLPRGNDDLRWVRLATAVKAGTTETSSWTVTLDQAVGFAWLNNAWRQLSEGRPLLAAQAVKRAARFLPALAERAEGVDRLLTRAFGEDYESGHFARAYRIAEIGVKLRSTTTSRDRLLAAAVKRIESLCDQDRPASAEMLLGRVGTLELPDPEWQRLQRGTAPLIAAAAVRTGDLALARRAAARYARVERDRVEADRLVEWVERRSRPDEGLDPEPGPPLQALPHR